jgi:NAD(P)-dependent dehydrogenase (short-subunit alcohol dehydrogenase family)
LRLRNKVAVITGGAKGIGRAVTLKMLREGALVAIADIDEEACKKFALGCTEEGKDLLVVNCDVSREIHVEQMLKKVKERYGRIDVLVNNAGVWDVNPFVKRVEDIDEPSYDRVMEINVKAAILCCKHVIPYFREVGGGSIVIISSTAGLIGGHKNPAYIMSKHALIGLTRNMAADYARENIRVNAVCPGLVDTELTSHLLRSYGLDNVQKVRENLLRSYPVGRMGTPEEIANVVAFVASDEASYMYGSIVVVDGGRTAK